MLLLVSENSEALKILLENEHLRAFLQQVDASKDPWKAMKIAMLEPLFIEFANECLKVVEPEPASEEELI